MAKSETIPHYYTIESAEEYQRKDLSISLPSEEERKKARAGYLVKLIFTAVEADLRTYTEKLWVRIQSRRKDIYRGVLCCTPVFLKSLIPNEPVIFGPEHILKLSKPGNTERFVKK